MTRTSVNAGVESVSVQEDGNESGKLVVNIKGASAYGKVSVRVDDVLYVEGEPPFKKGDRVRFYSTVYLRDYFGTVVEPNAECGRVKVWFDTQPFGPSGAFDQHPSELVVIK